MLWICDPSRADGGLGSAKRSSEVSQCASLGCRTRFLRPPVVLSRGLGSHRTRTRDGTRIGRARSWWDGGSKSRGRILHKDSYLNTIFSHDQVTARVSGQFQVPPHENNIHYVSETRRSQYHCQRWVQETQGRDQGNHVSARSVVLSRLGTMLNHCHPRSTVAVNTDGAGEVTNDLSDIFENLERDTMGTSWRTALQAEFTKPYFRNVRLVATRARRLWNTDLARVAQGFFDSRYKITSSIPTRRVHASQ